MNSRWDVAATGLVVLCNKDVGGAFHNRYMLVFWLGCFSYPFSAIIAVTFQPAVKHRQLSLRRAVMHIPIPFLSYCADILADTNLGLSGSEIIKSFNAYAVEHNVNIPHASYPFDASNKRTALLDNLRAFPAPLQYKIIRELCDHRTFVNKSHDEIKSLKIKLVSQFAHLAPKEDFSKLNETLTEETRHWLDSFPNALELYMTAIHKYRHGIFSRNLLDDLRLSLELLLRAVFLNEKSLENQLGNVGAFVAATGGSKEFSNMFSKLLDYYSKYQNTYVKHDDAVVEEEIEFIFEISSSFMRHIIRLYSKPKRTTFSAF